MKVAGKYKVKPGRRVRVDAMDPDSTGAFKKKDEAVAETESLIRKLDSFQEKLYAENKRSLLIILQAVDTGGKDGTIRHVMKGINPQGCLVTSFKAPTPEERSHDFLWRIHQHVPARGYIGIFNRSHYEDVLITRVHDQISDREAARRFREINDFEKMLVQGGTTVLKFYLTISRDEQRRRIQDRLDDPRKRWKFNPNDLVERRFWKDYARVYAEAITATNTAHAPWYLIPANHEWYRNYLVARIIVSALKKMNPKFPPAPPGIAPGKIKIPV